MRKQFSGIAMPDVRILPTPLYGCLVLLGLIVWMYPPDYVGIETHPSVFSEDLNLSHYPGVEHINAGVILTPEWSIKSLTPSSPKIKPPSTRSNISLSLASGDNLSRLLNRYQLTNRDIYAIERVLTPYIAPRDLQVGHKIELDVINGELQVLKLAWEFAKQLSIFRSGDHWALRVVDEPTESREYYAAGVVSNSLYQSALRQYIPAEVIKRLMSAYGHVVDFQRDIRVGDEFKVLYSEQYISGKPEVSQIEQLSYVELVLSGKSMPLISYLNDSGTARFYDPSGKLADNFLMKMPVKGANLSSYFGKRLHPILGYSRYHKGLDFSAPINTPVMATGHGTIEKIGNAGSFGKRIKIKHINGFHTLYAHLNGFAKGLKVGSRVAQGDVIGYLGNTGLSQARHLHYEVHKQGRAIDPLTLKQTSSVQLTGDQLKDFNQAKQRVQERLATHQSKPSL